MGMDNFLSLERREYAVFERSRCICIKIYVTNFKRKKERNHNAFFSKRIIIERNQTFKSLNLLKCS